MPLNKPIESITEDDLRALVDLQKAETKTLEYKRSLPGGTDEDKKEFLADASAFANAAGGDLLFGIEGQSGLPTGVVGVQLNNVDDQKLRLENLLRDGISPRLPRVAIHTVQLLFSGFKKVGSVLIE